MYYSWGSYFAIDEGQRWAASGSLRASITQLDLAKPRNPLGHKECPGGSKREGVGWKSIYLVWLSMFIDLKCILFFEALLSPVRVFIQSGIKFPPAHVFFFFFSFFMSPLQPRMQSSEGGSDTTTSVATLRTSSSAQAPVVQPVPASQQVGYHLFTPASIMTGQMGKVCNDLMALSYFFPNVQFKRLVILETKPATRYISACAWCLKKKTITQ